MANFGTQNQPFDDSGQPNLYLNDTMAEVDDNHLTNFDTHMHTSTNTYLPKIDDVEIGLTDTPYNIGNINSDYGTNSNNGMSGSSGDGALPLNNDMDFAFSTPTKKASEVELHNQQNQALAMWTPNTPSQKHGADTISAHTRSGGFTSGDMMHGTSGFGDFMPQSEEDAFRLNEKDTMGPDPNTSFTENQFMAQMAASNRLAMGQESSSQGPVRTNLSSGQLAASPSRRSSGSGTHSFRDQVAALADGFDMSTTTATYPLNGLPSNSFVSPFAPQGHGTATASNTLTITPDIDPKELFGPDITANVEFLDFDDLKKDSQADAYQTSNSNSGGSQRRSQHNASPSLPGSSKRKGKSAARSEDGSSYEDEEPSEDESPSRKRKRGGEKKGTGTEAINKNGQPRKPRAPRAPLRKWAHHDLSMALIGVVWACGESGLKIPFDQAAQLIDQTCTAGALQQAILKLHEAGIANGLQLPKIRMHWTKKGGSTSTVVRDTTKQPRRKPVLRRETQSFIITLKRAYIEEARLMLPYPYDAGYGTRHQADIAITFEIAPMYGATNPASGFPSSGFFNDPETASGHEYQINLPDVFSSKPTLKETAERRSGANTRKQPQGSLNQNTRRQNSQVQAPGSTDETSRGTSGYSQQTQVQAPNYTDVSPRGTSGYSQQVQVPVPDYMDETLRSTSGYSQQAQLPAPNYMPDTPRGTPSYSLQTQNQPHGYMDLTPPGISGYGQQTMSPFAKYGQYQPDASHQGLPTSGAGYGFPQQLLPNSLLASAPGQYAQMQDQGAPYDPYASAEFGDAGGSTDEFNPDNFYGFDN